MTGKPEELEQKEDKPLADSIVSYISSHPGIHFNDLLRALNIAAGTLQYHLNQMEGSEAIIVHRKRYYTRYFPPEMKDPTDQKIMVLLRQRIPRSLLLHLLEFQENTGTELTKVLNITKSTLSYYTTRLEKLGMLNIKVVGREKRFSVVGPQRIANLLKEHQKSFGDEMVDRFVDLWVRI